MYCNRLLNSAFPCSEKIKTYPILGLRGILKYTSFSRLLAGSAIETHKHPYWMLMGHEQNQNSAMASKGKAFYALYSTPVWGDRIWQETLVLTKTQLQYLRYPYKGIHVTSHGVTFDWQHKSIGTNVKVQQETNSSIFSLPVQPQVKQILCDSSISTDWKIKENHTT